MNGRKFKYSFALLTFVALLFVLVSLSVFYSCGANIFSESQDVELGQQLDKEIKSMPNEYPMLQGNQEIKDYVNGIGKYILNSSPKIERKKVFPYTFQVINDTIINAFCTPGGYIYVYTGLMKFLDNEATLAGIVAHEIAHAERRHMTQRLTSYYGVSMILSLVLGNNPNAYAEIAANLVVGLGFLANSRSDEEEADNYSIAYLKTSKYYPGAIKFFFNNIIAEQKKRGIGPGGGLDRLLSTHPLPQDRIDNVVEKMKGFKDKDTTKGLYADEYRIIKSKLPK